MNRHVLVQMLMRHEGLRLRPYDCSTGQMLKADHGRITIGYGRNLQDVGISTDEAKVLLFNDVDRAFEGARELFPALLEYTEARQHALICMVFNLGQSGVGGFRKMRQAIKDGDWKQASIEAMDSEWARQVGGRAIELARALENG